MRATPARSRGSARRQEPGHAALRERQAGRQRRRSSCPPAHRREPDLRRHPQDRRALYPQGAAQGLDQRKTRSGTSIRPASSSSAARMAMRPHRPQDHRRHLWRRGPAWRRRVLRQGPDQGRPLGRLCRALSRQERRGRGPRRALHHPARPMRSASPSRCRSMSTRTAPARSTRAQARKGAAAGHEPDAARHPRRIWASTSRSMRAPPPTAISAARRSRMAASPGRRPTSSTRSKRRSAK